MSAQQSKPDNDLPSLTQHFAERVNAEHARLTAIEKRLWDEMTTGKYANELHMVLTPTALGLLRYIATGETDKPFQGENYNAHNIFLRNCFLEKEVKRLEEIALDDDNNRCEGCERVFPVDKMFMTDDGADLCYTCGDELAKAAASE